jgi:hypothetical protein
LWLHLCNISLEGEGKLRQPCKEDPAQNEQKFNKKDVQEKDKRQREDSGKSRRSLLKNEEIVQEELTLQKGPRSLWGDE